MRVHHLVDWISFTVPVIESEAANRYDAETTIGESLTAFLGDLWARMNEKTENGWVRGVGRSPYNSSYANMAGMRIYYRAGLDHLLVEIEGRGCAALEKSGLTYLLLKAVKTRATRIDIATDLLTELRPTDFVKEGVSSVFKSHGSVVSETGDTQYIGSRTSQRYARVYRYNKPHPRSDYMRIEYVFRKEAAKDMASKIVLQGLKEMAKGSSTVFGWKHPIMAEYQSDVDMTTYRPERKSGKTLRWLISQCAPAFKKLVDEGVIEDPKQFLDEYFMGGE